MFCLSLRRNGAPRRRFRAKKAWHARCTLEPAWGRTILGRLSPARSQRFH
jgi:hypothetical protein